MATDYFLKIDGIPGESRDGKHKDEIEVQFYTWGAQNVGEATGGSSSSGKAQMADLNCGIKPDKAYPALLHHVATGAHIKSAILTCRRAGGKQEDYARYALTDIIVTSVDYGSQGPPVSNSRDDLAKHDAIWFSFSVAELELEYKEQKADGSLGPATKIKYNLKRMQAG